MNTKQIIIILSALLVLFLLLFGPSLYRAITDNNRPLRTDDCDVPDILGSMLNRVGNSQKASKFGG